jgi:hypothetical protein
VNAIEPGAIGSRIVSREEYALLGVRAGQAGFSEVQLSSMLAAIERAAQDAALNAAKQTAMTVLPELFAGLQQVHVNTATQIRDALSRQLGSFGGTMLHSKCVAIVDAVMAQPPQPYTIDQ